MKDTSFYNQESTQYSLKRYPKVAQSYTQFFFNRRLSFAKKYIAKVLLYEKRPLSLLELGCADGIVVREFEQTFPGAFSKIVGVDVSPGMVEEARRQNKSQVAEFFLRQEYANGEVVDVVNETGVINYAGFDQDVAFVENRLKRGGWYVLSVAGTNSLRNTLKGEGDFIDFRSYREYESLLREKFTIHRAIGCGVFVPHLWKIPALARLLQPIVEVIIGTLIPSWCHEKIYLLRIKR
jgi:SAM-dependent methyltransferase